MLLKQSILQLLTSSQKHKTDDLTDDNFNPKLQKLNPTSPAQIRSMIAEHSYLHTICYNNAFQAFTDAQITQPQMDAAVGGISSIIALATLELLLVLMDGNTQPRIPTPGSGPQSQ